MKFAAHKYQLDALRFLLANPYSALYADPGTGKTSIILMLLTMLKKAGELPPCLITAPLRVATSTWPNEIAKWDQFNHLTFEVLHGPNKWEKASKKADIHLINVEGLRFAEEKEILNRYKMLIVDESSKFKNWSSGRTKILKGKVGQFIRRHCLTGSPAPRSLIDLFAQQYLSDAGATLGKYITHYRNNYFEDRGYTFPDWQLKSEAEKLIYDKVAPRCYRLDAQEVLDMPELVFNDIKIQLDKKILDMSFEALSNLGFENISASSEYAAARQIAGGFTARGEKIHEEKIKALCDLLEEMQGKNALVFFYYRAEGEAISKALGGAPIIYGGTSAAESNRLMGIWNRGGLPALLLHPASAGHGLNLQDGGSDVIWYSYTDNQDDYMQAICRVYRQGVKGKQVRVHRLIADKTIDVAMIEGLEAKGDQQKALLDAVQRLQDERKMER